MIILLLCVCMCACTPTTTGFTFHFGGGKPSDVDSVDVLPSTLREPRHNYYSICASFGLWCLLCCIYYYFVLTVLNVIRCCNFFLFHQKNKLFIFIVDLFFFQNFLFGDYLTLRKNLIIIFFLVFFSF